jgi:branched-chain amino acid transport system substrate-binding protein
MVRGRQTNAGKLLAALIAIALMALVAGCGGSDDDSDSGGGGGDGEPIRIGAQLDLTGPASFAGIGGEMGIKMAFKQINENGGIDGRKLELVTADSETTPAGGALAARQLVQQEKVDAVLSVASSTSTLGAKPVIEQVGTPMIATASADDALLEDDPQWIWRGAIPSTSVLGELTADFVNDTYEPKTVGLVLDTAQAYVEPQRKALEGKLDELGIEVVATETIEEGAGGFPSQVRGIQQAKPDVVVLLGYTVPVADFALEARNSGVDVPFVGDNGQVLDDFVNIMGKQGDGYVAFWTGANEYLDVTTGPMGDFLKAFDAQFPKAQKEYPNYLTTEAYADAFALADALTRADEISPEAIQTALNETSDFVGGDGEPFDYAFAIGLPRTWTADDHNGTKSMVPMTIENGKWVAFDGGEEVSE